MKKVDVIKHFGGVVETAKALGIKSQSVSGWPDEVPELRAFQIEKITSGKLKADFIPQSSATDLSTVSG
ncbi:Cro/CI family transcriptional regulator [Alishewanella sp. SMS8]|uniref:Cro/CI family transcriptional regulator n=1 Tax=Alishewanella sp. SMS8 TaxID=2994676 RepID=UPI0027420C19|nr:Cro/CI family transcriptional regulator [Alishewanella sp. SMS8]MDP5205839.1 Cro/CI family transcriptional regulator [Alishewanella sp. SMS9]MDP5459863.1 Cro/CI family transcriptional regulator [Alishewanella sp. SMS8]